LQVKIDENGVITENKFKISRFFTVIFQNNFRFKIHQNNIYFKIIFYINKFKNIKTIILNKTSKFSYIHAGIFERCHASRRGKKEIKIINYWPIFWQQRAGNASYPAEKQIKPMAHMTSVL